MMMTRDGAKRRDLDELLLADARSATRVRDEQSGPLGG